MPEKAKINEIRNKKEYQMISPERRLHPRNPHVEAHSNYKNVVFCFSTWAGEELDCVKCTKGA